MAGSTSKKVVAIRFDREPVQGFVNSQSLSTDAGIELLTTSGSVVTLPYSEVKAVCFVREFAEGLAWKENRAFPNRPKTEGLWIRFRFRDGDTMEAVVANNLLLVEAHGMTVAPASPGFLNQKMFVPRVAANEIQVLGVIGSPVRKTVAKPKPGQLTMFE